MLGDGHRTAPRPLFRGVSFIGRSRIHVGVYVVAAENVLEVATGKYFPRFRHRGTADLGLANDVRTLSDLPCQLAEPIKAGQETAAPASTRLPRRTCEPPDSCSRQIGSPRVIDGLRSIGHDVTVREDNLGGGPVRPSGINGR
jgi:hypothetical protein